MGGKRSLILKKCISNESRRGRHSHESVFINYVESYCRHARKIGGIRRIIFETNITQVVVRSTAFVLRTTQHITLCTGHAVS